MKTSNMQSLPMYFVYVLSFATIISAQITPRQCAGGFQKLQFNVSDYAKYPTYFSPESVMTLAEAGEYIGPGAIEEYVKFASLDAPYFLTDDTYAGKFEVAGFNPAKGTCDFLFHSASTYQLNPAFAAPMTINVTASLKVTYDATSNKISRANVFYSKPFLNTIFSVLRNRKVDNFICQTIISKCACTRNLNRIRSIRDCRRRLRFLPRLSKNAYFDGRDYSCRVLHATFAAQNPTHCNHLSFIPAKDPFGDIKCQKSSQIPIHSLFSMKDLESRANFSKSINILPAKGFAIICKDSDTWKSKGFKNSFRKDCAWIRRHPHIGCKLKGAAYACAASCNKDCPNGRKRSHYRTWTKRAVQHYVR